MPCQTQGSSPNARLRCWPISSALLIDFAHDVFLNVAQAPPPERKRARINVKEKEERDPQLPTSVPIPLRIEDIHDPGMRAMWEMDARLRPSRLAHEGALLDGVAFVDCKGSRVLLIPVFVSEWCLSRARFAPLDLCEAC